MGRLARADAGCTAAAFFLIWGGLTLAFDAVIGYGLARQCWACTYAETTGTVTASRADRRTSQKGGVTTQLVVRYEYAVDGKGYAGDRYRYVQWETGGRAWADVAADLPVGRWVPVYYDPADPADAVLRRGPMGMDLFLVWFLTPFNVVLAGGVWYGTGRHRRAFDPADRRRVVPTAVGWRLRPDARDAVPHALTALLVVTFAGVFVIGLTLGAGPPLPAMAAAWVAAIGLAVWYGRRTARRTAATLDAVAGTLTVGDNTIPVRAVTAVAVREETGPAEHRPTFAEHPVEVAWGDPPARAKVCSFYDPAAADAFAGWLRAELRAAGGTVPDAAGEWPP